MFEIEFSSESRDDLKALRKAEQVTVLAAIEKQLQFEPDVQARNRKRLRPNALAEWELRIGKFRVFYNVDQAVSAVTIEAVGFKIGNLLFIRNERRHL